MADLDRKPVLVSPSDKIDVQSMTCKDLPRTLFEPRHHTFSLGDDMMKKYMDGEWTWPGSKPDLLHARQ